jgi:[ribosomal protein S5]-alanine N-acetyltransferase
MTHAVVVTDRLVLRPFRLADAPDVQRLAGAPEVAAGTLTIPHPYPDGAAEAWISSQADSATSGQALHLAVERRKDGELVGAIGLEYERDHDHAELGYWIGVPYWNNGYATEAATAVLRGAFEVERLNRVVAYHFTGNPASGRVLQKLGMKHEGTRRQHSRKGAAYLDSECYAILRTEWEESRAVSS